VLNHVFKGNTVTHRDSTQRANCAKKANVKSLFYFCFSSSGGYEKINAREESNFVVLSIAACES